MTVDLLVEFPAHIIYVLTALLLLDYFYLPSKINYTFLDEQGIVWVEFHLKINQEFNSGLESGTYNGGIVKPHNGHWTYFDKSIELKTGDLVHYWIHVNHNGVKYNSEKRQFRVTGKKKVINIFSKRCTDTNFHFRTTF